MIIGHFAYNEPQDNFSGYISTLTFQFTNVEIMPVENKVPKGPDYRLVSGARDNQVELGSAWKRTSAGGSDFLSVELDSPLLDKPLYAAVFRERNSIHAKLVWSRMKPKAEEQANPDAKTKPKPRKAA